MKYFNIRSIKKSIRRVVEGGVTHEHRTSTVATGLSEVYFPVNKFAKTPEQIQEFTRKRPDISIEKYVDHNDTFLPHCYIEVKSLINSHFDNILNQLHDTIFVAMDDLGWVSGNFSVFIIAIKGTKIAFYLYHSFSTLLDDYDIPNYKGFIPLNFLIPWDKYKDYYKDKGPILEEAYLLYKRRVKFTTDPELLTNMGAESNKNIAHPHILDMLNESHNNDIHEMFSFMANNATNAIL